jgi:DNA polymerase
LEDLQNAIRGFDGIDIKRMATNMVFGSGNPKSRVMVIGQAPEAEADRHGTPFMGEEGALLDKMFACIGLDRRADSPDKGLYISNILNWRPPGNRSPSEVEISLSLPFIERHVALAQPAFVVLMGADAANPLLNRAESISKLRGKFYDYTPVTAGVTDGLTVPRIQMQATYHPSFLLKTPLQKKKAWQDLLMLQAAMEKGN